MQVLGISIITLIVAGLIVAGWIKYNIYASQFSPTKLDEQEQNVLDTKLAKLEESAKEDGFMRKRLDDEPPMPLVPEKYSEKGARREIDFTEKELNALIANNPEVAGMVAIDLSKDLVSLKVIVPMDEDIFILGGKTLRLKMGIGLGYQDDQLFVVLKGVSMGGVPIPNAWLGNVKNKNLMEEFGGEGGFWDLFAAGVKDIRIKDGHLSINLKE
ncbi:MAG: arginine N-succinyltransferase [Deltaproteobacteria bacterium]|nr:arginine N-succinyltransferase [Deltaproteobacteria bacterium]